MSLAAPKVCIGIATAADSMSVQTALSLTMLVKATQSEIVLTAEQGPYTHWNRETILRDALDAGCSHLLFVDTDVSFPKNALDKLLVADKDVIGANYHLKQLRFLEPPRLVRNDDGSGHFEVKIAPPVATYKLADADGNPMHVPGGRESPTEPFPCSAVATGLMLVKLGALDGLEAPFFYCEDGEGEDVFFCRKLREAGREIWCDPTIPVAHIGPYAF